MTSNGDGTSTLTCPDSDPVVIRNGTDGVDGVDGTDGTNGVDGTDGMSCTAVDNGDGTKTVTCEDGSTFTITDGRDGSSCTVVDNGDGSRTISCADGSSVTVTDGVDGADGADGADGMNVDLLNFHGEEALLSSGEFALETNPKYYVDTEITAVSVAAGITTVDFSVTRRGTTTPVTDLASVGGGIAKLVPAGGGDASNHWVSYIYRAQTVSGTGSWPPGNNGVTAQQATRESSGTTATTGRLTNNGDGTYRYVFVTNLTTATVGTGGPLVGYDAALTHRVMITMGGHSGPTGTDTYDFRPDGAAVTETRNIVETATCQNCHGQEFHGHGGDRITVESCVVCHNAGNVDPHGGETIDFRVMIHRIHAGSELATIPGPDGIVWNDPRTTADESADNGFYGIWGNRDTLHEWWEVGFPAVIENCTACHQGSGEDVANWQEVPSRQACGSCHNDVNFATPVNHPSAQTSDAACAFCHTPSGSNLSIADVHDWQRHDPRHIAEHNATITLAPPANGTHYVDGEAPVVTVTVYDRNADGSNGALVTGDTFIEDATSEGCSATPPAVPGEYTSCDPGDNAWRTAALFVHGPRAENVPVLTTAARAQALTTTAGPWNLTGATSFRVYVDSLMATRETNATGGDVWRSGDITVSISGTTFPDIAAVTADQLVTWLNANTAFRARAIAEIYQDGTGRVSIRSRNLGRVHSIQPVAGTVTTALFGANGATVRNPTGSTAANTVSRRTTPANNDPRVTWGSATDTFTLRYQLDPVDDLEPGTYTVNIEFNDAGNISPAVNTDPTTNYRTPTVARTSFQVGTATEEPFVARNCSQCHQGPQGTGFVLDFVRHYKIFNDSALDQCTACHDYMPQYSTSTATTSASTWTGSRPISRRVHAVHYGSSLNYPLSTVDYSNGDPIQGRNWNITFPQDVRNCETCHTAETSGTWATEPSRLPCSGCHDSDAAMAHMRAMTADPTPAEPWSGDEIESCSTCH